ncbi:hypothetical protein BDF14DRAFT_1876775 [Spinellus fusiger]|nr:hypothetical protein BDF14DRAFT_1876775 [Spinellus fusiger]
MRLLPVFSLVLAHCLFLVNAQLDSKTNKLVKLAKAKNGLIQLTSETYTQFTQGKRNYGMVVVLTALSERFQCTPCRDFDPEYRLVASSFQTTKNPARVFFGSLDFEQGQAIYQQLGLQTAPNVFYFPPSKTGSAREPERYDLNKHGFTAEAFAEFLSLQLNDTVPVNRPINYMKVGLQAVLAVGVLALLRVFVAHFRFIIYHKNTWALISILIILVMTSGHMWNRIRTPPYVMPGKNGQINYIASGFQQQLGMESHIVASIYGVLAFSITALICSVPSFDDSFRQRTGVYIWMMAILFIFSCLMNLFKLKNGGYPFKILF